jgi:acetyltransferase-like isoleucine patch superfamily enzyme
MAPAQDDSIPTAGATRTAAARSGAVRALIGLCGIVVRLDRSSYRLRKLIARTYYATKLEGCGENCRFDPLSSEIRYEAVTLGDNVFIGPGAVIGRAVIGSDVMFGPNVHVRNGNHSFEVVGVTIQDADDPRDDRPAVVIEDDVWVGQDTTILPNGAIGEGSVVGTKSIVSRPIPPYVIAAGSPCRVLRKRFSDEDLQRHLALRGRSEAEIEAIVRRRARGLEELGHPG